LDDARRDDAKVALVRHTLAGYEAARLVTVAQHFADEIFERHLRPEVVERVRWHRDQGHALAVVSASFRHYVEPVATRLGFDAVLATDLDVAPDGRLTGELAGPNVRGTEKVRRLDEWLGGKAAFVWAYGDSAGDAELLARADRGILVGGGRRARR
jgi:phosphatidylglycerophosphatase C